MCEWAQAAGADASTCRWEACSHIRTTRPASSPVKDAMRTYDIYDFDSGIHTLRNFLLFFPTR